MCVLSYQEDECLLLPLKVNFFDKILEENEQRDCTFLPDQVPADWKRLHGGACVFIGAKERKRISLCVVYFFSCEASGKDIAVSRCRKQHSTVGTVGE